MWATIAALVGLAAANPELLSLAAKILPIVLKIAQAVQDKVLTAAAVERAINAFNAEIDALVSGADRAADDVADDMGSLTSDPENRGRTEGPG